MIWILNLWKRNNFKNTNFYRVLCDFFALIFMLEALIFGEKNGSYKQENFKNLLLKQITKLLKKKITSSIFSVTLLYYLKNTHLLLVLRYLGPLLLQTRHQIKKIPLRYSQFFQITVVFKSKNNLSNAFRCKDRIPKELTPGICF